MVYSVKTYLGPWVRLATCLGLFCGLSAGLSAQEAPAKKSALLIGVSRYEDGDDNPDNDIRQLPWVTRDITELAYVLKERGDYQTVRQLYDAAETKKKNDDAQPPTRQNIQDAIEMFLRDKGPNDTLMIYFSGHGMRDKYDQLYLVPRDCDLDRLGETAINAAWLNQQILACKAGVKFLVIDSCHAGGAAGEQPRPNGGGANSTNSVSPAGAGLGTAVAMGETATKANRKQLNEGGVRREDFTSNRSQSFVVFASCASGQVSYPYQPPFGKVGATQQSLYSYWLTQGLKGDADKNFNGVIEWEELHQFVRSRVEKTARSKGWEQSPERFGSVSSNSKDTPAITRLKPQSVELMIDEIAKKLFWAVKLESDKQGPLGVCGEFQPVGIGSTGVLGREIAARLYEKLKVTYSGRISVEKEKAYQQGIKNAARDKVGFFILGNIVARDVDNELVLRADVYDMSERKPITAVGGLVKLGKEDRESKESLVATEDTRTDLNSDVQNNKNPFEPGHSLEAEDRPFDIRLFVTKKGKTKLERPEERVPLVIDNTAYVELNIGETYEIEVDYTLNSNKHPNIKDFGDRACLQLFVDGISILNPDLPKQPGQAIVDSKGIQANANPKKRKDCGFWVLKPPGCRYQGYYFQTQLNRHYPFEFVNECESLVRIQGKGNPTGVISAFFYKEEAKLGGSPNGGTRPGKAEAGGLDLVEAGELGTLRASVHLQCISRDEMKQKRAEKRNARKLIQ